MTSAKKPCVRCGDFPRGGAPAGAPICRECFDQVDHGGDPLSVPGPLTRPIEFLVIALLAGVATAVVGYEAGLWVVATPAGLFFAWASFFARSFFDRRHAQPPSEEVRQRMFSILRVAPDPATPLVLRVPAGGEAKRILPVESGVLLEGKVGLVFLGCTGRREVLVKIQTKSLDVVDLPRHPFLSGLRVETRDQKVRTFAFVGRATRDENRAEAAGLAARWAAPLED